MSAPRPFRIDIPEGQLAHILERVRAYEWPAGPAEGGWRLGTNLAFLKDLCAWWAGEYDWRAAEAELNGFPQFLAEIDGLDIHFIHVRSERPDAIPILLSHGWPGSIVEFLDVIRPLAEPENDAVPAFHVVAPSLPGCAFSGKPANPIGPRAISSYFHKLMTAALGYDGYIAQGGDWGSVITAWLGFERAPACRAIHLNMFPVRPGAEIDGRLVALPAETEAEKAWLARAQAWHQSDGGYYHIQATRPETLSYAMLDSPVGVAAWIAEKMAYWMDGPKPGPGADAAGGISRERMMTNIMLYILTRSFNTAAWVYAAYGPEGSQVFPAGGRVEVPVGVANYPKEIIPFPPRGYAERAYNIVHWADMPEGGHFAAFERPTLWLEDVRAFVKGLA